MEPDQTGIQLFLSNRLENLADALIKQTAENPGNPLEPDTLVVQNRGMARWLNLRIAEISGIQMNTRYVYPRALIETLLASVNTKQEANSQGAFSQNALFWRVYNSLPRWSSHPKGRLLKYYLKSDAEDTGFLRRFQLSTRIAQHMDQLQGFRPDLLNAWTKQKNATDWRSYIWQSLASDSKEPTPPELYYNFGRKLEKLESIPKSWPKSLHIFGISSLPPIYLELLKLASKWMPVYIYLTQPSPLYWGDQISKKKQLKSQDTVPSAIRGHGLLGNLGKQGQDFLNSLIDAEVFARDESELFERPRNGSLLDSLQNDLFHINPPATPKRKILKPDGIQVHVCHSPKREIETLKEELLTQFKENPQLTPDQVVIMAPDIESYASSIRSVFGTADKSSESTIPYSIADYSTRSTSSAAHAFLSLLKLLESRFSANELMNFLSIPAISERFDFQQDDWNTLRTWIEDTNIRWGSDTKHHEQVSGVSFEEYSWQQGVDRLISGYCIHPEESSDWASTRPHPDMEGNALSLLNRFLELWQFLKNHQRLASQTLIASTWLGILRKIIEFLFGKVESQMEECQSLLGLLSEMSRELEIAQSDDLMTLTVIRSIFENRLAKDFQAGSFFSETITFCSLKPMRNVPAEFIGLIGMSESAFPRQDVKSEFNQFPDGYRIGDRSQREDDRYLFLESILAARRHLYISYTGIDSQTLNVQTASIVVEELLDSLDDYYDFNPKASARDALAIKEPLQPFSPSLFQSSQPTSYSSDNLEAAQSLIGEKSPPIGLLAKTITTKVDKPLSISLETFQRFFNNPCRFWLSERLETNFPFQSRALEDTEPIESNGLLDFQWGNAILEHPEILSGESGYLLNNLLPVGALGKTTLNRLSPEAEHILDQWSKIPANNPYTFQVNLNLNHLQLQGRIRNVSDDNYKRMRFGKIRSIDILSAWLEHLLLSLENKNPHFRTHIIGRDKSLSFSKPGNPREELERLQALYSQGQESVLPFFVDTAYQFAKATVSSAPRSRKTPSEIAYTTFTKRVVFPFRQSGEAYDTYNQLCFPYPDIVLTKDFENTALSVFGKALEHMEGDLP